MPGCAEVGDVTASSAILNRPGGKECAWVGGGLHRLSLHSPWWRWWSGPRRRCRWRALSAPSTPPACTWPCPAAAPASAALTPAAAAAARDPAGGGGGHAAPPATQARTANGLPHANMRPAKGSLQERPLAPATTVRLPFNTPSHNPPPPPSRARTSSPMVSMARKLWTRWKVATLASTRAISMATIPFARMLMPCRRGGGGGGGGALGRDRTGASAARARRTPPASQLALQPPAALTAHS